MHLSLLGTISPFPTVHEARDLRLKSKTGKSTVFHTGCLFSSLSSSNKCQIKQWDEASQLMW